MQPIDASPNVRGRYPATPYVKRRKPGLWRTLDLPERLLFLTLAAYLILNNGFSMLVIPPGIPVGEAVMVLCLLWFVLIKKRTFSTWMHASVLSLIVLIWVYATAGVAFAFDIWGAFAFRSVTHAAELGFLLLGMSIGVVAQKRQAWFRFFNLVLIAGCVYALLYPLRETLVVLSPTVTALAGYATPVFFQFITAGLLVLTFAMRFLLQPVTSWRVNEIILLLGALAVVFVMIQSRVNYGILSLLLLMVAVFVPRNLKYAAATVGALALLLLLFFVSGIEFEGRIGTISGFDFIERHFRASFGITDSADMEGAASGVFQRFEWWQDIWHRLTADDSTFLLGLGQGVPLTWFYVGEEVIVREPHNSAMTTIGRYGLVGTSLFVVLYVLMFKRLLQNVRLSRNTEAYAEYVTLFFFILSVLTIGMVEDALEKPYYAIPYYFVWGIAITRPGGEYVNRSMQMVRHSLVSGEYAGRRAE